MKALWLCLLAASVAIAETSPRNVIVLIADGAGYNTWAATAMWTGTKTEELFPADDWVRVGASTYPLRIGSDIPVAAEHALTQFQALVYDPVRAWDPRPAEGGSEKFPYRFAGYRWLRETAPDSAGTATAIATGLKTYNGSINVDGAGNPAERTIAGIALARGMRAGSISSVPFPHATPAIGAGAQNKDRSDYCGIVLAMLGDSDLNVIAGAGNPEFDHNGVRIEDPEARIHTYVGGKPMWDHLTGVTRLTPETVLCGAEPEAVKPTEEQIAKLDSWRLVQSNKQIERLARGKTPERLLLVPEVGQAGFFTGQPTGDPEEPYGTGSGATLQQGRGSRADPKYTEPGYDPLTPGVPSLETLTRAALNALDDDPEGFFLQVEGGAVDWAMHANEMGRMIEEMLDFQQAIQTVIEWVDERDAWDETLVIVTADHDHMLWGPNSHQRPFDPLVDNGAGKLPSYRWLSDEHSNALVPLFARGVGVKAFERFADQEDPFRGRYLDQTEVFEAVRRVLATD